MKLNANRIVGRTNEKGYFVTLQIGANRYYDDALLLAILSLIPEGMDILAKIERDEPFDIYF